YQISINCNGATAVSDGGYYWPGSLSPSIMYWCYQESDTRVLCIIHTHTHKHTQHTQTKQHTHTPPRTHTHSHTHTHTHTMTDAHCLGGLKCDPCPFSFASIATETKQITFLCLPC